MEEDYAHAQGLIDNEILRLRGSICSLLTRRNDLSPIGRLPVEILSTIFYLYQQSGIAEDETSVAWTQITHVCTLWRRVTVNLPKLWTHIAIDYPEWAEEMLVRSQNLGFVINISSGIGFHLSFDKKLQFIQACITNHVSRVQEINIRGLSINLQNLFPTRAQGTNYADQLTSFRLSNSFFLKEPMATLEKYFINANKLKVLEITCTANWDSRMFADTICTIDWDSKLFTNLAHLKVDNAKYIRTPSAISFYGALKRMSRLESLELRGGVLPIHPPQDPSAETFAPALLLNLKTLVLVDDPVGFRIFFAHVRFPSATSVSIHCSAPATEYRTISNTLVDLPSIYAPLDLPVSGLRLDFTKTFINSRHPESLQIDFDLWSSVPSAELLSNHGFVSPFMEDPFLRLGLAWQATRDVQILLEAQECLETMENFCLAVPCQNLRMLALTSSDSSHELPPMAKEIFSHVLGMQPELHTLFVTGKILTVLLKDILPRRTTTTHTTSQRHDSNSSPSSTDGTSNPHQVLFPNMRTLWITDTDFSHPPNRHRLLKCLTARSDAGYKLEKLALSDCTGLENSYLIEVLSQTVNIDYYLARTVIRFGSRH